MSTLEVLGCIALAIFLAPYALGVAGWAVVGLVTFCEWCGDAYGKWRRGSGERCRCPRACPRHKKVQP